ncbi:MAG: rhodanese-like domain-containing protein [Lachnospiraceae bacterium]
MGLFDFLLGPDINQGIEEWKSSPGAVLIDVRTVDEYRAGHIPGSINIPLDSIDTVTKKVTDRDTRIFVHCLSGSRSAQAAGHMKRIGYTNVVNIGGISRYRGKVEV